MTQVVHNAFVGEYYTLDGNKKHTIQLIGREWTCTCYQSDCKHIKAVQQYIKGTKCQLIRE